MAVENITRVGLAHSPLYESFDDNRDLKKL